MSLLTLPTETELKAGLQDKTVIVTGGSRGIGFAIAELCIANGAMVVIADLDEEIGRKAAEQLGHNTLFVKCNVALWGDQLNLFSSAVAHSQHGYIDAVVCNAGIDPEIIFSRSIHDEGLQKAYSQVKFNYLADEMEGDALRCPPSAITDVNLNGVIYGIKLAEHHFRKSSRGGRIVIIGSAAGYISIPTQDIYCASKHAVLGLMRSTSARPEIIANDITISLVAPWLTATAMTSTIAPEYTKGRLCSSSADVAAAAGLLLVRERKEVNGKAIWVQGQTYTEVEDSITKCHVGFMQHGE